VDRVDSSFLGVQVKREERSTLFFQLPTGGRQNNKINTRPQSATDELEHYSWCTYSMALILPFFFVCVCQCVDH